MGAWGRGPELGSGSLSLSLNVVLRRGQGWGPKEGAVLPQTPSLACPGEGFTCHLCLEASVATVRFPSGVTASPRHPGHPEAPNRPANPHPVGQMETYLPKPLHPELGMKG